MSIKDADLDSALRRWGDEQRKSGTADAPAWPAIADLLTEHKRRNNYAAVAATVVLVAVLAVGLGLDVHRGPQDTSASPVPSHTGVLTPTALRALDCSGEFTNAGSAIDAATGKGIVSLRYAGAESCRVLEQPQLALVNAAGRITGPDAAPVGLRREVTVRYGQSIAFRLTGYAPCLSVPRATYTLSVHLRPTPAPRSSRGISVPLGEVMPMSSRLACLPNQPLTAGLLHVVGDTTKSHVPIASLRRIAHQEARTVGDPAATAEAVLTTYDHVEPAIPIGARTEPASEPVWVIQIHGDFYRQEGLGPPGTNGDYVLVVVREHDLQRVQSSAGGETELSRFGTVVQLIP